ncbi:peptidase T2 asparaginase 2 [Syncephalis plumigaleata]|nr:peptidase T2 asparaginase 2 [Syncephalis plumigaleata]
MSANKKVNNWSTQPVLVIHGGAGTILRERFPPERQNEFKNALLASLNAGMKTAVMSMEDCPLFNCGKGSVFTIGGKNEMEACIADGRTGQAGSATLIHRVRNPIRLAREVLVNSPHFFLGGDAAEVFAAKQGLYIMDPQIKQDEGYYDDGDEYKIDIRMSNEGEGEDDFVMAAPQGTVGAVALDGFGNIAAATSTGGRNNKWDGRIGDTPILGAGSYAPIGNTCGISATGNGEYFIKYSVGHDVYARMNVDVASKTIVDDLYKVGGAGGLIAIDNKGNFTMPFNTPGMYRGYARHGETPKAFIFPEDE